MKLSASSEIGFKKLVLLYSSSLDNSACIQTPMISIDCTMADSTLLKDCSFAFIECRCI